MVAGGRDFVEVTGSCDDGKQHTCILVGSASAPRARHGPTEPDAAAVTFRRAASSVPMSSALTCLDLRIGSRCDTRARICDGAQGFPGCAAGDGTALHCCQ